MEVQLPPTEFQKVHLFFVLRNLPTHHKKACLCSIIPVPSSPVIKFYLCQQHAEYVSAVLSIALPFYGNKIVTVLFQHQEKPLKSEFAFLVSDKLLDLIFHSCPNLESLKLEYLDFSGVAEKKFERLTKLQKLNDLQIWSCFGVTALNSTSIAKLLSSRSIRSLVVKDSNTLSDSFLKNLIPYLPKLHRFYLENCPNVSPQGICHILNSMEKIPDRAYFVIKDNAVQRTVLLNKIGVSNGFKWEMVIRSEDAGYGKELVMWKALCPGKKARIVDGEMIVETTRF